MSQLKYLRRFAVASLLCLCVTAMACGGALVNANSGALTLGRKEVQAGFQSDKRTVTFFVAEQTYDLPSWEEALRWARLAPAPAGSFIMIGEAVGKAIIR